MKKNIVYAGLALSALTPAISFAALDGVGDLLCSVGGLVRIIIPIVVGLALVFFFWGLAQFIRHSGEEKAHEEGRNKMIWGILALFIMFSIFGILRWFSDVIEIDMIGAPTSGGCATVSSNSQFI